MIHIRAKRNNIAPAKERPATSVKGAVSCRGNMVSLGESKKGGSGWDEKDYGLLVASLMMWCSTNERATPSFEIK